VIVIPETFDSFDEHPLTPVYDNGRKTEADDTDAEMEGKCFPKVLTI